MQLDFRYIRYIPLHQVMQLDFRLRGVPFKLVKQLARIVQFPLDAIRFCGATRTLLRILYSAARSKK